MLNVKTMKGTKMEFYYIYGTYVYRGKKDPLAITAKQPIVCDIVGCVSSLR